MALVLPPRVLETSTTTGTGTYTLAGAVTGFQSFAAVGNANTCQYYAEEVDANGNPSGGWEEGLGTYTSSGTTLSRDTIYASSNSGSAVNWGAGTRRIGVTRAHASTLIVRQPGGTAGTDEGQVSHDGSKTIIESKDGALELKVPGGNAISLTNATRLDGSSGNTALGAVGGGEFSSIDFSSGSFWFRVGNDTWITRPATGVWRSASLDGSVKSWFQNSAGEAALESAYTDTDATLGNTAVSLTVIGGRSYRMEGYLIVSNDVAGEGAKFDFDGGTATMTTFDAALLAVGTNTPGTVVSAALATDLNYSSITGTNRIFVKGYLEVSAGGTFILRASKDTTGGGGTLTLAAGSWIALYDTIDL